MIRGRGSCPSAAALSREFSRSSEGNGSPRILRHVDVCASCQQEWAALQRLRDLTRALPSLSMPPEEQEQVRTALLLRSEPATRTFVRRAPWLLVPIAAAAATFILVSRVRVHTDRETTTAAPVSPRGDTPSRTTEAHRGRIHASDGAVFMVRQGQPDEIVSLRQGSISVDVEPLHLGERFRVMTGDAEVEVHGTSFYVAAQDDTLESVNVVSGRVLIRVRGREPIILGPRGHWEATPPERSGLTGRKEHPIERRATAMRPAPAAASPATAAESAFADGWQALRNQRFADAAAAFKRASAIAGDQPLAEDSWFWMAVCEARIPRPTDARSSLAGFIDRFPRSARRGEASAMLGWILLEDGDLDDAARRFGAAQNDRAGDVRQSAQMGLDAVAHKRRGSAAESGSGGR